MNHVNEDYIFACHIAGVYYVNRNHTIEPNDYSLVKDWVDAIKNLELNGILFYNNFSDDTIANYHDENVACIKIEYDIRYNPNIFRYFIYYNYLQYHGQNIKHLFITDVSNVVVVKNSFTDTFF